MDLTSLIETLQIIYTSLRRIGASSFKHDSTDTLLLDVANHVNHNRTYGSAIALSPAEATS
jgi:hypothetical protein